MAAGGKRRGGAPGGKRRGGAPGLSIDGAEESPEERVGRLIRENPAVIFSQKGCFMSHAMKRLLAAVGANPATIELPRVTRKRLQLPPPQEARGCLPSSSAELLWAVWRVSWGFMSAMASSPCSRRPAPSAVDTHVPGVCYSNSARRRLLFLLLLCNLYKDLEIEIEIEEFFCMPSLLTSNYSWR
ncbi:monothiol glutaredoxin-S2-like [Canna indica]|uniref:Monothiol glutaredoxin-S2-like n=1 Tax=Canna indica TaxID=4628 RepID=A0AAQ3KIH3_9LILI|nr:monothiol glutaredoxin-S2-like [Canna indica]